jgi:FecR protein
MKTIRKLSLGIFFALLFANTFVHATPAREDDANDVRADSRVISARAGRVNFVSGDTRLRRADSLEWSALTAEDELKSGDTVNTGHSGRVEILLNPGSYFRAGAGAEFTLAEADLDDLRVELARGSAVVEATGYSDTELSLTVATPRTTVYIVRTGIYRINASADGTAEVGVFEGRALVNGTMVKGGKLARAGAAGVEVTKLDKKNRDELDLWSRDRGKELARANEKLQRRDFNTLFASNSFDRLFGSYYGNGFWFYNDRMRCYTFVPFSYGWSSPYGYGYGTGVIPYAYPSRRWPDPGQNPQTGWTPPSSGGGSSGGGTSNGGGTVPVTPTMPRGGDVPDRAPTTPRTGGDSSPRMDRDPAIDRHPRRDNR